MGEPRVEYGYSWTHVPRPAAACRGPLSTFFPVATRVLPARRRKRRQGLPSRRNKRRTCDHDMGVGRGFKNLCSKFDFGLKRNHALLAMLAPRAAVVSAAKELAALAWHLVQKPRAPPLDPCIDKPGLFCPFPGT